MPIQMSIHIAIIMSIHMSTHVSIHSVEAGLAGLGVVRAQLCTRHGGSTCEDNVITDMPPAKLLGDGPTLKVTAPRTVVITVAVCTVTVLYNHPTVTVQSLYSQCTVTAQPLYSQCTVTAQPLCNHCTAAA